METIYTSDFIKNVFHKKNIGNISKIIEIPYKNDPSLKRVILYIYLKQNEKTQIIRERFSKNQDIKIIYNDLWFWKIFPTINTKRKNL
jgi:hypothetical protein